MQLDRLSRIPKQARVCRKKIKVAIMKVKWLCLRQKEENEGYLDNQIAA